MLFTAPLFKILSRKNRKAGLKIWGYVDNGLFISFVCSESKAIIRLQEAVTKIKKWLYKNGLNFDLEKFEIIYFSRK